MHSKKREQLTGTCALCAGTRVGARHCLGHLSDEELREVVEALRNGRALDARGAWIEGALVRKLISLLTREGDGELVLPFANFGGAVFVDDVDFKGLTFGGEARFSEATFCGKTYFSGATFLGEARFRQAVFQHDVRFGNARFEKSLYCGDARFHGRVSFRSMRCRTNASFLRARFHGDAVFADTRFGNNIKFNEATFAGAVNLARMRSKGRAEFFHSSFLCPLDARNAQFEGPARFDKVVFPAEVRFDGASFEHEARFGGEFGSSSDFRRAIFHDLAAFGGTTFLGRADFSRARICGLALFNGSNFQGPASFGSAEFGTDAEFSDCSFAASARFSRAVFGGDTRFNRVVCKSDARFKYVTFERSRTFGRVKVEGELTFDGAVFSRHVSIEAEATLLSSRQVTFSEGVHMKVAGADIVLDDADFVRQSILVGDSANGERAPRLLGIRRSHVAPLVLSELDLRPCRFFGAHGLESMQIEESCDWPSVPTGQLLSRRHAIAEEHVWRRSRGGGRASAWYGADTRWPGRTEEPESERVLSPLEIASLYRALRKGREDAKDQAGAGDLYYGEMEMRRHAEPRTGVASRGPARSESAILWTYWLLSGYGLRASRALISLVATLLIAAALLCWFGFHPADERNFGRAFLFALESSISLLRPPAASLTVGGQVVQVGLRLLGPLLAGLALLAVRARVKR
jgi:uncharacterized protein YjbI with pentapeptide repeats